MRMFLSTLLMSSITMSVVILVVIFLNKALINKVSAAFRYYIWLVVLIGLLIPFRPNISVPFVPVEIPIFGAEDISEPINDRIQNIGRPIEVQSFEGQSNSPPISDITVVTVPAAERMITYTLILFGIWGIGVLVVLAFHLRLYGKFISSVRRWGVKTEDSRILSVWKLVKDDMKIKNNQIRVETCVFISSPLLIGFRNPTILLPKKEISTDELEHIFRHELIHYKRKDLWINLLVLIVFAIHWFNPFIYLMRKTIHIDCEIACDEAVVANNDMDKRRHYGEAIIGFIGTKSEVNLILSTYFYGRRNSMKKRLSAIMNASRKGKGLAVICAIVVIGITFLSGTVFAATSPFNKAKEYVGEVNAKSIALEHAGLSESQVVFIKARLDYDDRRIVYDVEFYSGNTEYDYEIDAVSGAIIKFDRDIEHYSLPKTSSAPSNATKYIGDDKAKTIALEHAVVSESQVVFMKTQLDYDDGRVVYDIEFYDGTVVYNYEIDAISGTILEYDSEIEYYTMPNNSANGKNSFKQSPQQTSSSNEEEEYIVEDKAKFIALSAAGLSENQISHMKIKLDHEDGKMVYEVEFNKGRTEYDYEIDAISGAILKSDVDYDD